MRFIVSSFVFFQASSNSEQTSSVCVSNSLVSILHRQTSTTFEQQKPINLLQVKTPALGCLSNHYNQFHLFLFIALLQQTLVRGKNVRWSNQEEETTLCSLCFSSFRSHKQNRKDAYI